MPRKGLVGRKQRWKKNCDELLQCLEEAEAVSKRWEAIIDDLVAMQREYQNRLDSLPTNLRNSQLARQLQRIVDFPMLTLIIDHASILSDLRNRISVVQNTPLPDAFKAKERGTS